MKCYLKVVTIGAALSLSAVTANASVIIFDGNNGGSAKTGVLETGVGANTGNPDVWGTSLAFSDFSAFGGISVNDNLNSGSFKRSDITTAFVDQDMSPGNGGLGACAISTNCSGSTDSFQSNLSGANTDEVIFFDFAQSSILDTVWFNGDHQETVDGSTSGALNVSTNALFNIFYSEDGMNYEQVFSNQVQPVDLEYLSTGIDDGYQYWAVAASGWGSHASYIEAIAYSAVPAPATLALFGLGIAGLGAFSRKKQS
jgi:hypothetical protein